MRYTVILTDEVKAQLRALPLTTRREIGHKLFLLEDNLSGDVQKLKGSKKEYRLRIGNYRALF
jgi:mRNA-degrading endonuclease RelE of RelBE toxin-antitoxin system